jgi:hypothetical protein
MAAARTAELHRQLDLLQKQGQSKVNASPRARPPTKGADVRRHSEGMSLRWVPPLDIGCKLAT